ncbi:hypothetical protein V8C86DRAFT_2525281 [Haematococcus lacustris]
MSQWSHMDAGVNTISEHLELNLDAWPMHSKLVQAAKAPKCCVVNTRRRRSGFSCRAESKEYYDLKDMPPLPLVVKRIHIPQLQHTVVDKESEEMRMASLAIFYDIYKDEQYGCRLTRKSALTALCMYDRDDVDAASRSPGEFPNIDLLQKVYEQGLDVELVVEEVGQQR